MRRILLTGLWIALPLAIALGQSGPSLADVARANREREAADEANGVKPRVITNKDLPSDPGVIPESNDASPMTMVSGVSRPQEHYGSSRFVEHDAYQEHASGQWRERIEAQEERVGDLQARIDQANAAIHASGGTLAPNRYQAREMQRLSEMQKMLDFQKRRLAMMQEAARHAGMHTMVYDP